MKQQGNTNRVNVIEESVPIKDLPVLVQVNYSNYEVGFYHAKSKEDAAVSYLGNIVALFIPQSTKRNRDAVIQNNL